MHFNIILPAPPAASAVMIAGLNPAYDNRISFIATGTPPPPPVWGPESRGIWCHFSLHCELRSSQVYYIGISTCLIEMIVHIMLVPMKPSYCVYFNLVSRGYVADESRVGIDRNQTSW